MEYFETIRCEDYSIFNLDYHFKRVLNTIGKELNLNEYIYPPSSKLYRCKLAYNNDEIINVEFFEYKKRIIKNFKIIYNDEIDYSKKYIKRTKLDELYAQKNNCDEIIIVKNDLVTDTSIANIALFYQNRWITPDTPLLKGTTRARLLDEGKIFEERVTLDILKNSTKIALMNAMIGFDILEEFSFKL